MPISIRLHRRSPVQSAVTYNAGSFQGQGTIWNLSCTAWRHLVVSSSLHKGAGAGTGGDEPMYSTAITDSPALHSRIFIPHYAFAPMFELRGLFGGRHLVARRSARGGSREVCLNV